MDINLIFKIAGIGIIVAILSRVLHQAGREEMAVMTTLTGTIVVLLMIIGMIVKLFDTVRTMFQL